MTAPSRPGLRGRVAAGDHLGVLWLALGSAAVAEMAARARPGALVIDLQHGLWDRAGLEAAVGLARPHCPVLVRVEDSTPLSIGRALDSGADGVIVPMVETAAQAAAAAAAGRFPPHGIRSGGGVRPLGEGFADYLARAEGHLVAVMIETAAGVEAADAIAAVPGIDMVLIGTGDLLLSYGGDADRREAGCARVLAATRRAGIAAGIFTMGAEAAKRRRAEGYALTVLANDIDAVRSSFAAAVG